jgi:methionine-rich copper-binding protein CopC
MGWRTSILEITRRKLGCDEFSVGGYEVDRTVRGCWKAGLLALFLMTGASSSLWAHAILMESAPALNSTVKGPNFDINLRYNVRIDGGRSRVRLVAPDGTVSTLTLASQATPDTLQTHATGLKPGAYKLQWQVLASDGHMSRGEIPFTVT